MTTGRINQVTFLPFSSSSSALAPAAAGRKWKGWTGLPRQRDGLALSRRTTSIGGTLANPRTQCNGAPGGTPNNGAPDGRHGRRQRESTCSKPTRNARRQRHSLHIDTHSPDRLPPLGGDCGSSTVTDRCWDVLGRLLGRPATPQLNKRHQLVSVRSGAARSCTAPHSSNSTLS